MTYLILSVVVLAGLAATCWKGVASFAPRPLLMTAGVLAALTLVFDNVIVRLGIVAYDADKTLGVTVPWAPVEDFAYALGAVILVPTLWKAFGRRDAA